MRNGIDTECQSADDRHTISRRSWISFSVICFPYSEFLRVPTIEMALDGFRSAVSFVKKQDGRIISRKQSLRIIFILLGKCADSITLKKGNFFFSPAKSRKFLWNGPLSFRYLYFFKGVNGSFKNRFRGTKMPKQGFGMNTSDLRNTCKTDQVWKIRMQCIFFKPITGSRI